MVVHSLVVTCTAEASLTFDPATAYRNGNKNSKKKKLVLDLGIHEVVVFNMSAEHSVIIHSHL